MNSFGRQQGSCDLFVQQVNASQMGTWSCRMSQQGGGGVFHEAFLSALPAGERVKEGLRLPNSWKPDNYDIRIVTNFEPEFTFDGKVTATLKSNVAADKIVLHAKAMTIYEDSITVRDENGERIRISGFGYDDARNFVILYLDSSVSAEATVTVDIDYQGILNDELAGYYRSSYARKDGTTGYLGITQFEATDARKAFPCLDEPAMKAVFKLSLGRPQTYWSASNMPIRKAGLPLNPPRQGYVMVRANRGSYRRKNNCTWYICRTSLLLPGRCPRTWWPSWCPTLPSAQATPTIDANLGFGPETVFTIRRRLLRKLGPRSSITTKSISAFRSPCRSRTWRPYRILMPELWKTGDW